MHDIKKIKNKNFTLTFNPFFEFQNLQFYNKENFKKKKKSDLYLMKINISFRKDQI